MRIAPIVLALATALAAQTPVIIDTDAGSDDLMAIAFLLSRKDVKVEAITVVDGLAHVPAGAKNILRALELAGARVPVHKGRETPLQRTSPFPAEWRQTSDSLPGVRLPVTRRTPEPQNAVDYLWRASAPPTVRCEFWRSVRLRIWVKRSAVRRRACGPSPNW